MSETIEITVVDPGPVGVVVDTAPVDVRLLPALPVELLLNTEPPVTRGASYQVTVPGQPEMLTGFPLLIDLTDKALTPEEMASIRITVGADEVPREVVGRKLWTKVTLGTSPTAIHVEADGVRADYGPSDPCGSRAVWSDYFGVWRVEGDQSVLVDRSPSQANAVRLGGAGTITPAIVGDGVSMLPGAYQAPVPVATQFTVSAWAKLQAGGSGWSPIAATDWWNKTQGWLLMAGWPNADAYQLTSPASGGAVSPPHTLNEWQLVTATWTGTTAQASVNGVSGSVAAFAPALPGSATMAIGSRHTNDNSAGIWDQFPGSLSEIRMSRSAHSPAWIAAEYQNQSDPASFYTLT